MPPMNECDFCSDSVAPWRFPCTSFAVPGVPGLDFGSGGDWAACDECKPLVESRDLDGLMERWRQGPAGRGLPAIIKPRIMQDVRGLWRAFFDNWSGNVVPNGPAYAEPDDGKVMYLSPDERRRRGV